MSTITRFEIFVGSNDNQHPFWNEFYKNITILPFDDACAFEASAIAKQLKKDNKMIGIADILIAATAVVHNMPVSTLNIIHFQRIEKLKIISI
ncbi:MAG: type II toxin-antitoxin system VapC family toxin [Bacteroidia bacterium]|nr:type II toxin-antitoxin system VapC family toxin [Bacteroidia bacterium]